MFLSATDQAPTRRRFAFVAESAKWRRLGSGHTLGPDILGPDILGPDAPSEPAAGQTAPSTSSAVEGAYSAGCPRYMYPPRCRYAGHNWAHGARSPRQTVMWPPCSGFLMPYPLSTVAASRHDAKSARSRFSSTPSAMTTSRSPAGGPHPYNSL